MEAQNTCDFCKLTPRKYSCPRCNSNYCSLTCYRSQAHVECTETFYKDCVMEQLAQASTSTTEPTNIQEILKRMHEANQNEDSESSADSDDEEYSSLGDRLAGIDLDDSKKVWEQLTADERQEFEAFLRSEDVSKLVPKWKPWWEWHNGSKVQEVEDATKYKEDCPEIKGNINTLESITKKQPADCVKYNLMNIIGAYVFTTRYFNGDHLEFIQEAVSYVTTLSLCLKDNRNMSNQAEAIDLILQECLKNEINVDAENARLLRSDVKRILRGPCASDDKFYVLCALSEIHKLVQATISKDSNTQRGEFYLKDSDLSKKRLKLCLKKIEYHLSYVASYYTYKDYVY